MNYEIVELSALSGSKATIYSVILEDEECTLFDHFVQDNSTDNRQAVKLIINRIREIGHTTGARTNFFKHEEGKPGDGVCALYDDQDSLLRLYCIRYGSVAILLGSGGPKPPGIRAWQQDSKLKLEAERMIRISKDIMERIEAGDLQWSPDGMALKGNLKISDNDD